MSTYKKLFNPRQSPQSKPIPGQEQRMVKNRAGGYGYEVDKWTMLDRFLILGSDQPTYYASAQEMTLENARNVIECLREDGGRVLDRVLQFDSERRAPKMDPLLFVLALAGSPDYADVETRRSAYDYRNAIARTSSQHMQLTALEDNFRGWGRLRREAVADWYNSKPANRLAYQMLKYQSRYGYSQADMLRLGKPVPPTKDHDFLYAYFTGKLRDGDVYPEVLRQLAGHQNIKATDNPTEAARIITEYNLTWEMVPGHLRQYRQVWEALLPKMPLFALLRNLGNLTEKGIINAFSPNLSFVTDKLTDEDNVVGARIHPVNVLQAMSTYRSGHGFRGNLTWNPVGEVIEALNETFNLSFGSLPEINGNTMICLDVSGSMGSYIGGTNLTSREVAAAMALALIRSSERYMTMAFTTEFQPLPFTRTSTLGGIVNHVRGMNFGGTNCALPLTYALGYDASNRYNQFFGERGNLGSRTGTKIDNVDNFVILTDSETWAGPIHVSQALSMYQKEANPNAKVITAAFTSTGFSIADPNRTDMLDVVGLDTATPNVIQDFASGKMFG